MSKNPHRFPIFVMLALLTACSSGNSSSAPPIPGPNFSSTFGGYFQVTGGNPPASVVIAGTGTGTDPTGASHALFTQTVVFSSTPNQITNGTFGFTYADGSTLNGTYAGTATPPDKNGYTKGSGSFSVTSGTGRFANAAGHTGTWTVAAQIFAPGSSPAGTILATFQGILPT